jgi:FHA domain/Zinc-ribbon containing domain
MTQEGGHPIFDSVGSSPLGEAFETGFIPGSGTYFCLGCGSQVSLAEIDRLPKCSACGGLSFRRDSIFTARQEHGTPTAEFAPPTESGPPDWLPEARRSLSPGQHLAYRPDDGTPVTFPIERGWTRIGRSATADLRLDDPSVSRRHALIVAEPGKELHVLDDRSLNGILVNSRTVEWGPLHDGDELAIGRFRLYALKS